MTKQGKRAKRLIASFAVAAALALCAPVAALADDALGDVDTPAVSAKPAAASSDADAQTAGDVDTSAVQVSKEGDAAALEGSSFAISDFSRAQKGSNRSIDGEYRGYAYLIGQRSRAGGAAGRGERSGGGLHSARHGRATIPRS